MLWGLTRMRKEKKESWVAENYYLLNCHPTDQREKLCDVFQMKAISISMPKI